MVMPGKFQGPDLVEQLSYYQFAFLKTSEVDRHSDLPLDVAERDPDQLCYVCDLSDVDKIATRHCPTCGSQPRYEQHADRHPLTCSTCDHSVEPLTKTNASSQDVKDDKSNLPRCIYKKMSIVAFFQTCNFHVCSVCLASGHDGHRIQTLTSAPQERRELVIAADSCRYGTRIHPTAFFSRSPVAGFSSFFRTRLQKMSGEKDDIQNDAKAASNEDAIFSGRVSWY